jgi:hypothetical protein
MKKFICLNCNIEFKRKSHLDQHVNRKYPCKHISTQSTQNPHKTHTKPAQPTQPTQPTQYKYNSSSNEDLNINADKNINNESNTNINLIETNECNYYDEKLNYECKYCFIKCSRKDVLKRHLINYCKVKKKQDEQKEDIFKKLLEQENLLKEKDKEIKEILKSKNEQLEQMKSLMAQNKIFANELDVLKKKMNKISSLEKKNKSNYNDSNIKLNLKSNINIASSINNSNNISNTNSNNVVFQLVNYGKEDLDKIDIKDFLNNIVKNNRICGVKISEEILKLIHFNPNYPELNNIYISDINREKCMIYDDGMWKLSTDDKIPEVIDKVVKFSYDKQDVLREKFPDNKPLIDRLNTINKYTQFTDSEYLEGLKEEQELDQIDNSNEIKRCEEFQKKTYNTFKTTMYNEGLKIKKKIK